MRIEDVLKSHGVGVGKYKRGQVVQLSKLITEPIGSDAWPTIYIEEDGSYYSAGAFNKIRKFEKDGILSWERELNTAFDRSDVSAAVFGNFLFISLVDTGGIARLLRISKVDGSGGANVDSATFDTKRIMCRIVKNHYNTANQPNLVVYTKTAGATFAILYQVNTTTGNATKIYERSTVSSSTMPDNIAILQSMKFESVNLVQVPYGTNSSYKVEWMDSIAGSSVYTNQTPITKMFMASDEWKGISTDYDVYTYIVSGSNTLLTRSSPNTTIKWSRNLYGTGPIRRIGDKIIATGLAGVESAPTYTYLINRDTGVIEGKAPLLRDVSGVSQVPVAMNEDGAGFVGFSARYPVGYGFKIYKDIVLP